MNGTQLEFPERAENDGVNHDAQLALRAALAPRGWATRRDLTQFLGWDERTLRDVAESLGADIVRGQRGFHLTETLTRDDLAAATQAADAAISQAKKQERYGIALRHRLHRLLG